MKIDNAVIHERMTKIAKELKKDDSTRKIIIDYDNNTLMVFFKDERDEVFENE